MEEYIYSAGIVPVRYDGGQRLYLLLRSFNHWDFPKGVIEKDENSWQAALRELDEETGIKKVRALFHQQYYETPPYSRMKIARYYIAEVNQQQVTIAPNPETGIIEHHEFKWLPYGQARTLLVPRVQAVLDWAENNLSSHTK